MTAGILKAIGAHFTANSILNYLIRRYPQHQGKIVAAQAAGYTGSQILQSIYRMNGGKPVDDDAFLTEHEKVRKKDKENKRKERLQAIGALGVAGAVAAGAYGYATRNAPVQPEVLPAEPQQRRLPEPGQRLMLPGPGGQGGPQGPTPSSPGAPQGPTTPIPRTPQAPSGPQAPPSAPTHNSSKNIELVKNLGEEIQVSTALRSSNDPLVASKILEKIVSRDKLEALKQADGGLQQLVKDYSDYLTQRPEGGIQQDERIKNMVEAMEKTGYSSSQIAGAAKFLFPENEKEQITPQERAPVRPAVEEMEPPEQRQEMPQEEKLAEKIPVMIPGGQIGDLESSEYGVAKINVDGKIKSVKSHEIIESPISQKDLASLYDELNQEIERTTGEPVSRNVSWAGYDPNVNELVFLPHDGGAYVYDNIPEDLAKGLVEILTLRKTTGENFIGAWQKNTKSPIGAAMSALIQKLQKERGGKGSEYVRKFQKIYDALEPAKEAKKSAFKEKQALKKQEKEKSKQEIKQEKERLKKEKRKNEKTKKSKSY